MANHDFLVKHFGHILRSVWPKYTNKITFERKKTKNRKEQPADSNSWEILLLLYILHFMILGCHKFGHKI